MFDNTVFDLLDAGAVVESGLSAAIRAKGESIAALVSKVKEKYATERSGDLIKLTNKTSTALRRLGNSPLGGASEYGAFIDDLYFIFHEGPGQRLAGSSLKASRTSTF
jgi:hypothetical protein